MTEDDAYADGRVVGEHMARQRAGGDYSFDVRYDLAAAARVGRLYFAEFKRGLEEALGEQAVYWGTE